MTVNTILSVIIVNFNGKYYAARCIESVIKSNYRDLEVILVDNGSTDGSLTYLAEKYQGYCGKLNLISLDKNYGPAKARNEGSKAAKGKYFCFLDNDTIVDENWAVAPINAFKKDNKIGIIQSKLLLLNEVSNLDCIGDYLGQNGFLVQRVTPGTPDNEIYNKKVEILAAKSAGMFIRKKTFEEINGFDEDYFIYMEETDLGWRSWLAGYKAVFIPASIVYHEFGTSSVILDGRTNDYNAKFHGSKNYIMTLYKNLGTRRLLTILPKHILLWLGIAWFSLLKGKWRTFVWIHKGIFWNVANLRRNRIKRVGIQRNKVMKDSTLFKIILRKKPFIYFLNKVLSRKQIGNAEGFIKVK